MDGLFALWDAQQVDTDAIETMCTYFNRICTHCVLQETNKQPSANAVGVSVRIRCAATLCTFVDDLSLNLEYRNFMFSFHIVLTYLVVNPSLLQSRRTARKKASGQIPVPDSVCSAVRVILYNVPPYVLLTDDM